MNEPTRSKAGLRAKERKKQRGGLSESEERLRLALDTASLGFYERNLVTNEVIADPKCREIMGLGEGTIDPEMAPKSLYPADRERILTLVARAFHPRLREICGADFRIVRPNGEVRWVEGRGQVVFDDTSDPPRPLKFLGVLQDITERKATEHALVASEKKYRGLFEANQEIVGVYRVVRDEAGIIVDRVVEEANTALVRLTRAASIEQLKGRRLSELLGAEYADSTLPIIRRAMENGTVEYFERRYEGREHLVAICPLDRETYLSSARDITDLKNAQAVLRQNEERLRFHLENTPMAVIEWDAGLRVTRWAGAAERIFGWTAAETVGKRLMDLHLIHERDIPVVTEFSGRLTVPGRQVTATNRNYTKDGRVIHCTWYNSVLLDRGGRTSSIMSLVQDNTAQVQAEESLRQAHRELERVNAELERRVLERTAVLQETTEQLNDFVHTLAHDLRAPVRAQMGFATLLLEQYAGVLGESGSDYARRIADAAKHQAALLDDLLKHVRLSRADLPLEPVEFAPVIQQAQADLVLEIQQKQALIEVGALPCAALANPASVHLAVVNLLSNALKFVSPGVTPHIRIWAEERGAWVRLWVEDNGIGIAAEHMPRLFGIFERLHNDSTTYPGTGIGLALVKKATERTGGRVGVESERGKGSRFWIELRKVEPSSKTRSEHAVTGQHVA